MSTHPTETTSAAQDIFALNPPADNAMSNSDEHYEASSEDILDRRFVAETIVDEAEPIDHFDELAPTQKRSRTRMFCFECNRQEGHFVTSGNRFFYSFLLGLTFGLIYIVGPYSCQCCGAQRLFRFDRLNPFYWLLQARNKKATGSSRRRRRR